MSAVPAIATQLRSCGKSRASSYYVLEKRRSPAPPPPVPRRRRALKLRRGQDRATGPGLDQHSAFETVRRVAGQSDRILRCRNADPMVACRIVYLPLCELRRCKAVLPPEVVPVRDTVG